MLAMRLRTLHRFGFHFSSLRCRVYVFCHKTSSDSSPNVSEIRAHYKHNRADVTLFSRNRDTKDSQGDVFPEKCEVFPPQIWQWFPPIKVRSALLWSHVYWIGIFTAPVGVATHWWLMADKIERPVCPPNYVLLLFLAKGTFPKKTAIWYARLEPTT